MNHHQQSVNIIRYLFFFLMLILLFISLPAGIFAQKKADAVVLINSRSPHFSDFEHYIKPYLDTFGIPYTTLDIATLPVNPNSLNRALIIVGHNGLDESGALLSRYEESYISKAVQQGSGLVNFDSLLVNDTGAPRYSFIQKTLNLSYTSPPCYNRLG